MKAADVHKSMTQRSVFILYPREMHRDAPLVMCNGSKAETAQLPISSGMD